MEPERRDEEHVVRLEDHDPRLRHHAGGALHPRFRKSRLPIADDLSELPNATLAAFPRAAGVMAKARVVILEPHDVLFIPPLWLHHVTALDELTLSVNIFSHSDEQGVFDELFALAVPFLSLIHI